MASHDVLEDVGLDPIGGIIGEFDALVGIELLDRAHVLVVDDIVDTGRSLAALLARLRERGPASLASCVLLDKPYRREVEVTVDFVGFTAPPVFLVGYGMDFNERLRRLRGVYELSR